MLASFIFTIMHQKYSRGVVCSEQKVFEGIDFFCWVRLLPQFLLHVPTRVTFCHSRADPVKNCSAQILENTIETKLCLVLFSDYNSRKSRGGSLMVAMPPRVEWRSFAHLVCFHWSVEACGSRPKYSAARGWAGDFRISTATWNLSQQAASRNLACSSAGIHCVCGSGQLGWPVRTKA